MGGGTAGGVAKWRRWDVICSVRGCGGRGASRGAIELMCGLARGLEQRVHLDHANERRRQLAQLRRSVLAARPQLFAQVG